ncbi:MAG: phage holin family protein [Chloroflexia bacterium]
MTKILIRWAVTVIAVFVAATLVPGIHYVSWVGVALFALVLGLVNAVVKPIVTILALPAVILTLGLVLLVINAAMFGLAAALVPGFHVDGFLAALLGSIVVSLVSWLLSAFLPD